MDWLWIHCLALLAVTFCLGLWLGRAVSAVTTRRVARVAAATQAPEMAAPVYQGVTADPMPVVAEPPPPVLPPAPVAAPVVVPSLLASAVRKRAPLLFPVNQFGIVTVTQAPVL